jgi:thioredoxin 1
MAVIASEDSNFEEKIKSYDTVMVKYFADWCGTCKLFAPKYKRISADERFKDVLFLEVNAETNPIARKAGEDIVVSQNIKINLNTTYENSCH